MELREYAKKLIRPYVLRGDTLQHLADGMMGVYCREYHVQIAGYIWNGDRVVKLGRYEIGVTIPTSEEIGRFSLKELYKEVLLEKKQVKMVQLSLF